MIRLTGGQVATTFHIANYPGTNGVVRGMDLMENMKRQALEFGTQIDDLKVITDIKLEGEYKYVETDDTEYYAKAIIIATELHQENFLQKVSRSIGAEEFIIVQHVMVQCIRMPMFLLLVAVSFHVEEAVFLTRYAKHVTIIKQIESV